MQPDFSKCTLFEVFTVESCVAFHKCKTKLKLSKWALKSKHKIKR